MHQDHTPLPHRGGSGFVLRHLFLLVVVLMIAAVVYFESRNMTAAGFVAVLLLLAHVVAVVVILYGGRFFLRAFFRKMHGQSAPQSQSHTHHHHAGELETEGQTISWARFYDLFVGLVFSGGVQKMMRSMVRLAQIQSGENVLDVGCGTGTLAILVKQTAGKNAAIHGLDAAPEMIERARQKAQRAKVAVDFQTGLVEDIRFPDGTFDVVMNSMMMHHLPAGLKEKALVEMYRVLKPGGRLLIMDFEPPKKGLYKAFLTLLLGAMTAIDNTTIPPLVEGAGFTDVKKGPTDTPIASYISAVKPVA